MGESAGITRRVFVRNLGALAAAVVASSAVLEGATPSAAIPVDPEIGAPCVSHLAQTFRKGDMFTIAGKYAINPRTGRETPHLQRFIVTRDTTAGEVVARPLGLIFPPLIDRGKWRTVDDAGPFAVTDLRVCNFGSYARRPA